jgi:hypothetical protein
MPPRPDYPRQHALGGLSILYSAMLRPGSSGSRHFSSYSSAQWRRGNAAVGRRAVPPSRRRFHAGCEPGLTMHSAPTPRSAIWAGRFPTRPTPAVLRSASRSWPCLQPAPRGPRRRTSFRRRRRLPQPRATTGSSRIADNPAARCGRHCSARSPRWAGLPKRRPPCRTQSARPRVLAALIVVPFLLEAQQPTAPAVDSLHAAVGHLAARIDSLEAGACPTGPAVVLPARAGSRRRWIRWRRRSSNCETGSSGPSRPAAPGGGAAHANRCRGGYRQGRARGASGCGRGCSGWSSGGSRARRYHRCQAGSSPSSSGAVRSRGQNLLNPRSARRAISG